MRSLGKGFAVVAATAGLLVPAAASAHAGAESASATDLTALPLGDGKVSTTTATRGNVFACNNGMAVGPSANAPWINSAAGTFDLEAKAVVDGSVSWPGQFSAEVHGKKLLLSGNDLPTKQTTGVFPVQPGDDAFLYDPNPNSIAAQSLSYELTAKPKKASQPSCLPGGPIGVAKNGVAIFNALDAANKDAVAHEVQDSCEGHPQQQSMYHYHSIPDCLTEGESKHKHSKLVGYALDGFPIYGPRGDDGKLLDDDDLDRCHGETGKVKLRGEKVKIYHYQATLEFPYTLGCFRGTPVATGAP